jgi:purine-binding chemotaxis protein CheW
MELHGLRSVQRSAHLTAVPCTPPQIAGILNVRGELVTVLDLAATLRLGSPQAPAATSQVLLVELPPACVGLLVDEVLGVEQLAVDRLDRSISGATYSRGAAEGSIVLLDLEHLLAEQGFDDIEQSIS